MKEKQEVIQIKLEEQRQVKPALPAKVAVRIKSGKQDIFVYNGASQYLVQAVLKELMTYVS
ncbi:hypothetical protein [Enterococcus massiliensis]|jgi:hypothetical protein|uniref:hypothetical protein n=1 Tax=Enterococcus massiliensis TaxID=1640685 RepID=UPI00065DDD91|nr:hypothetical protein [Enterococcus massiliensis]MCF1962942.1 hypothetical protein [Escherichia coli]